MTSLITYNSHGLETIDRKGLTRREWAFIVLIPIYFIGTALLGIILGSFLVPLASSAFWTNLPIFWVRFYEQLLASSIGFVVGLAMFLVGIPKIFRVPFGSTSIKSYLHDIKIDRARPLIRGLIVYLPILCIILLSQIIASYSYNVLFLGDDFGAITSAIFNPARLQSKIGLAPITANGSIFEEIALRGVVLTLFLKVYSERRAIVLSAIAFGTMHIVNLLNAPLTFDSIMFVSGMVLWTTIHGLMYGVMFLKVGNLYPNMALHWTVNGLGNCFIYMPGASTITYVSFNIVFNIGILSSILGILWILLVNKYWPLQR